MHRAFRHCYSHIHTHTHAHTLAHPRAHPRAQMHIINILSFINISPFSSTRFDWKQFGFCFGFWLLHSIVASEKWGQFCMPPMLFKWTEYISQRTRLLLLQLLGLWFNIEKRNSSFCLDFFFGNSENVCPTRCHADSCGPYCLPHAPCQLIIFLFDPSIYRRVRIN